MLNYLLIDAARDRHFYKRLRPEALFKYLLQSPKWALKFPILDLGRVMAKLICEVDSFNVNEKRKKPALISSVMIRNQDQLSFEMIRNQDQCTNNLPGEFIQKDKEKGSVLIFQMMKRDRDLKFLCSWVCFLHALFIDSNPLFFFPTHRNDKENSSSGFRPRVLAFCSTYHSALR